MVLGRLIGFDSQQGYSRYAVASSAKQDKGQRVRENLSLRNAKVPTRNSSEYA